MSENKIKVSASTTSKAVRVNVSTPTLQGTVALSQDTSAYNAKIAEQWAVSENLVLGQDYSSKYYANKAKESASNAQGFESATRDVYNGFLGETTEAIENVQGARDEAIANIETSRVEAVDSINSTKATILSDIEFVADGEKKEINDLADEIKDNADTIINRVGFNMFDTILKDHILTYEESKGLALQGTYVYKTAIAGERFGYPDFYSKCLEEFNEATTTETVNGVTVKVHSNGHKFYNIADKTAIDGFFNTMGSAWFYGIDKENERIFLPRNNWFEQATSDTSKVGDSVEAGLPNITASASFGDGLELKTINGAFYNAGSGSNATGAGNGTPSNLGFDASRSNAIYGKSDTVQPNAVKKLLYICVGNTVSDTSWVDVVTQVEGGVKDLEDKTLEGIERLRQSSTALTQTQITNCLLEVPQRIKYTLEDGTLTIKAGSVVIVPYGTTDRTSEFPVGATFLNNNFKVVDTQFADGKFFVWAELVSDHAGKTGETAIYNRFVSLNMTGDYYHRYNKVSSGDTTPTGTYTLFYRTDENKIGTTDGSGVVTNYGDICFPFLIATGDGVNSYGSIKQVFNGFGYIGSTVWADKGIKFLSANGRNADGTLNNFELETPKVMIRTNPIGANLEYFYLGTSRFIDMNKGRYFEQEEEPQHMDYALWYKPSENIMYCKGAMDTHWYKGNYIRCLEATADSTGRITSFNPKETFRAVDYNEFKNTPHITQTYVNGTSGYIIWSDKYCEQWGRLSQSSNGTTTQTIEFVKAFVDTNYSFYTSADAKSFTLTTTSCKASYAWGNGGSAYGTIFWIAKGYIA